MSDEQDGCEWVNISSSTGLSVKWLRVCVCVYARWLGDLWKHAVSPHQLSSYDDDVNDDDDDDAVLLFRHKRSSGRAVPVGPVRASATGCTRSGRTATRWCRRTCRRSSGRTSPARCSRSRRWASTTCSRLTSWTRRRCRPWSRPWNSCTGSVLWMTRDCSLALADGCIFSLVSCLIKDVWWSGSVWVGECFFCYRLTRVVWQRAIKWVCVYVCISCLI